MDDLHASLNCHIAALGKRDKTRQLINKYIANTGEQYLQQLIEIFEVDRDGEAAQFNPKKLENRKLLWHGSSTRNFKGILNEGLLVAPKGATITAHNFGKGIYFADFFAKSAQYTSPYRSNQTCLMLLCEVALGKANVIDAINREAHKLPKSRQSTVCLGWNQPDPKQSHFEDDLEFPLGKKVKNEKYCRSYSEFVVYNPRQVRMRYLIMYQQGRPY